MGFGDYGFGVRGFRLGSRAGFFVGTVCTRTWPAKLLLRV